MTATPADIAKFTSDGVALTREDLAIRDNHPDARDDATGELEMFFDNPADAQLVLNERFDLLSQISALHEGIEINEDFGFGSTVPLAPQVPAFRILDEKRSLDKVARTRAWVYEAGGDRYSVEVIE
jgi:hypothetical protein